MGWFEAGRLVRWPRRSAPAAALGALSLLLAGPAAAEDNWLSPSTGRTFNNPMSALVDGFIRDNMNRDMILDAGKGAPASKSQPRGRAASPAQAARAPVVAHQPFTRTDFVGARQRPIVGKLVAAMVPDPKVQPTYLAGVEALIAGFEQQARKNNVAHGMAFTIAAALGVERGTQLSDAETDNLTVNLNDILASAPRFAALKAPERQQIYDTCVTSAALIVLFSEAGKQGDLNAANAARQLSAQALASLGFR